MPTLFDERVRQMMMSEWSRAEFALRMVKLEQEVESLKEALQATLDKESPGLL